MSLLDQHTNHPSDAIFKQQYMQFGVAETAAIRQIPRAVLWSVGFSLISEIPEGIAASVMQGSETSATVEVPPPLQTAETVTYDIGLGGLALAGASIAYLIGKSIRGVHRQDAFRAGWDASNQSEAHS